MDILECSALFVRGRARTGTLITCSEAIDSWNGPSAASFFQDSKSPRPKSGEVTKFRVGTDHLPTVAVGEQVQGLYPVPVIAQLCPRCGQSILLKYPPILQSPSSEFIINSNPFLPLRLDPRLHTVPARPRPSSFLRRMTVGQPSRAAIVGPDIYTEQEQLPAAHVWIDGALVQSTDAPPVTETSCPHLHYTVQVPAN